MEDTRDHKVLYLAHLNRAEAGDACDVTRPPDHPPDVTRRTALKKPTPYPLSTKDLNRFWSKVDRSGGPTACWPWTGHCSTVGYGQFTVRENGRQYKHSAHRIAYSIHHGVVVSDLNVCHECDNRPCCNPAHLWLGTQADNMHDRDAKGRAYVGGPYSAARGEDSGRAKVTERDVREIRRLYASGTIGYRRLSQRYGVTPMAVKAIVTRKSWRHVDDEVAA